jgi:undecaprenyl-diphosphatase
MRLAGISESRQDRNMRVTTRSDVPSTRHAGDVVRLGLGSIVLAACTFIAADTRVTRFEAAVFHVFNSLPDWLYRFLWLVMQIGSFGAVFVLAGLALVTRRLRLAIELLGAGLFAYYAAVGLKHLVDRGRPAALFSGVVIHGTAAKGLGFPSGHAAVSAALPATAVPFLARRWRRWIWVLPLTVGVARMFMGAHLPLDVLGGFVLGWTTGAFVHLIGKSPSGGLSADQVGEALGRAGVAVAAVNPAKVDARGSMPFFAEDVGGRRVFVKAVGLDQRDADLLFKLWRFIAYRDLDDERPFGSAKRQLEIEALPDLLAAKAGVRTPDVVAIASQEDGITLLAHAGLDATGLDTVDAARLTDEVLDDLWQQVAKLHRARIVHRDLRLANVMIDVSGAPRLVDFGFAQTSASDRAMARDVAELLASQSITLEPARAVHAAVRVLGALAVAEALPCLRMSGLAKATRRSLTAFPGRLDELQRAAAVEVQTATPEPGRLSRLRPRSPAGR